MNILVLNYEYPPVGGGGAAVTKDLCEIAASKGHSVEVVTMAFKDLPQTEVLNGVTIRRVKCLRSSQRVCHPWEQFSYCVNAFKYIKKNLDLTKFDFIHCHFIIPTGLLALWLKQKFNIKYIVTAHGSDVLGHNNARFSLLYKIVKPLWKKILKNAAAVTAPSNYLVNKIKASYPELCCQCIPNGICVKDYFSAEKKQKSIITLTRLQESKGVQDLLSVCAKINLAGWQVNILGDGPYRPVLENFVKENNLSQNVFFRGHVTGDERMKYLSEAGLFFSGSKFEAFPLSVLEASLAKCFVIASNIEPHKMLVGENHIYNSTEELEAMLVDVIQKEPQQVSYQNEKFDWQNVWEQFFGLYTSVSKKQESA